MKEKTKEKKLLLRKLAAGFLTGACNGLFGGGGGMVAVPLLQKLLHMEPKRAHACAISIILPLSAVTAAVYAFRGSVEWHVFAYVAPALTLGSIAGAVLTGKIKSRLLETVFTALMFLSGLFMVFA